MKYYEEPEKITIKKLTAIALSAGHVRFGGRAALPASLPAQLSRLGQEEQRPHEEACHGQGRRKRAFCTD